MQQRTLQSMATRCLLPARSWQSRWQGMAQRAATWKTGNGMHLHRLWGATGHCGARWGFWWRSSMGLKGFAAGTPGGGGLMYRLVTPGLRGYCGGRGAPQYPQGRGQTDVLWP